MTDIYRPADGRRVPLPGGDGKQLWPDSGLPVDFSNPFAARMVRDGDLVKVEAEKRSTKKTAGDSA